MSLINNNLKITTITKTFKNQRIQKRRITNTHRNQHLQMWKRCIHYNGKAVKLSVVSSFFYLCHWDSFISIACLLGGTGHKGDWTKCWLQGCCRPHHHHEEVHCRELPRCADRDAYTQPSSIYSPKVDYILNYHTHLLPSNLISITKQKHGRDTAGSFWKGKTIHCYKNQYWYVAVMMVSILCIHRLTGGRALLPPPGAKGIWLEKVIQSPPTISRDDKQLQI